MQRLARFRLWDLGFALLLATMVLGAWLALRYHGERLERESLARHADHIDIEARFYRDQLSQTLAAIDLTLIGLLESGHYERDARGWQTVLTDALRHSPYMRSISLLDNKGCVVASTRLANLGLCPSRDNYLPPVSDTSTDMLHVGRLYAGRDLDSGTLVPLDAPQPPSLGFVPVRRALSMGEAGGLTLLATLNLDYFLNRIGAGDEHPIHRVDIARYDGAPFGSSYQGASPASLRAANTQLARRWQTGAELGQTEEHVEGVGDFLTAWRVTPVYPLAVIARTDRAEAQTIVRAEHDRLLRLVGSTLAVFVLLAIATYGALRVISHRERLGRETESARRAALIDALPADIALFGPHGQLKLFNPGWASFIAWLGLPSALCQHGTALRTLEEATPADSPWRATLTATRHAIEQGGAVSEHELQLDLPQGRRWLRILVRPLNDTVGRGALVMQLDITERREAEERLRLDALVFATGSEAIVVTDASNRILSTNPAFTEVTGYQQAEVRGRNPSLMSSGLQDRAFYRQMWATLLETGRWEGEIINRRKNGECYPQWLTISTDRDAHGRVRHFVGVFADISARKAAEEAVRESREQLQLALQGGDLGLWDWHVPSGHVDVNQRWAEMLGLKVEDLAPSVDVWQSLVHPDDWPEINASLLPHLEGHKEQYESEHRLRHRDGHWVWVLDRGRVVERTPDGRPLRAVGTHLDITERRVMLERLQENEATLRQAQRVAGVGSWTLEMGSGTLLWSEETQRIFGLSPGQPSSLETFLSKVHPEDLAWLRNRWNAALRGEPYDLEHRIVVDGQVRWVREVAQIQRDAHGEPLRALGAVQDITQRKLAEERLHELATTDSLTGVRNRRSFMEHMTLEFSRHVRHGRPAAVLMTDLDHFKRINDRHGHATGDAALIRFTRIVESQLRTTDVFGRLGGEEFGILLLDTPLETAREVAERIRKAVGEPAPDPRQPTFTVSIGVAMFRADDPAPDSVLARADAALYRAKSRGRNRVASEPEPDDPDLREAV